VQFLLAFIVIHFVVNYIPIIVITELTDNDHRQCVDLNTDPMLVEINSTAITHHNIGLFELELRSATGDQAIMTEPSTALNCRPCKVKVPFWVRANRMSPSAATV